MSTPQPFAAEPSSTAPFRRAFNALIGYGRDMLGRVQDALVHGTTTHLPRRFARNPITAEQRLARTLDWVVALARTLAGDTTWLIVPNYRFPSFPGRYPALTAKLRAEIGLPPIPPRTEAQKAAAHRRYVRRVFATQPTAKIAARLARRLGIKETSDAWPHDLLALPQTPAAYAKATLPSASWGGPGWGPPVTAPARHQPPPPSLATGPPRCNHTFEPAPPASPPDGRARTHAQTRPTDVAGLK